MKAQFKDSVGRWLTSGLFKETAQSKEFIQFTLEEAKQAYLSCEDLTGYLFATTFLGGWQHFLALKESPALTHHIVQWEDELEVKLRSSALQTLYNSAKTGKDSVSAKYIVNGGWKRREGAGRPTKEERDRATKIQSKIYDEFGLKLVK